MSYDIPPSLSSLLHSVQQSLGDQSWVFIGGWYWSWNSNTLATWCEELTHLKRPWCWKRLRAGGEGDDGGWDRWMASQTQWIWVWVDSGSWWWTGRPAEVHRVAKSRTRMSDWTELNWGPFMLLQTALLNYFILFNEKLVSKWAYLCERLIPSWILFRDPHIPPSPSSPGWPTILSMNDSSCIRDSRLVCFLQRLPSNPLSTHIIQLTHVETWWGQEGVADAEFHMPRTSLKGMT